MQKTVAQLPEIKLIGITCRTNNSQIFERDPSTNKIAIDEEFETLIIPAQNYAKFTNQSGPMPAVCIDMWQNILKMNASDLGGERAYIADFEVYDERSVDHNNVTLDIYIGTENEKSLF